MLKTEQDLGNAFTEPSLFEKTVDVDKELSVIVSRNAKGEVAAFPVVELEFNPIANLVEFLFSPADVSEEVEKIAQQLARRIIGELEMVGILAVEFFLDKQGNVLVNEMAPRPHNSGHQSIEGNYTSQFMQHLRAILNLPLGNTEMTKPSVMVNLLGEDGFSGEAKYEGLEEIMALKGVNVHLYGKQQTRPFRKMGHVTVVADTLEEAKQRAIAVQKGLRVIC